jgi:hypothetical protein
LGFLRTNIRQIYSKFTPGHPTKTKNHLLTAPIAYFLSQCQKVSKAGVSFQIFCWAMDGNAKQAANSSRNKFFMTMGLLIDKK